MATNDILQADVLGVPLALTDYSQAVGKIEVFSRLPRPSAISFCNTHLVAEAAGHSDFLHILRRFDLNLPDGMPLVWALNCRGAHLSDRVYGPYLMRKFFLPIESARPLRHFLFGGTEQTLTALRDKLAPLTSAAHIVGTLSPPFRPFTEVDQATFADTIRQANPDCIWVALGGVRQERWIAENLHRFDRGVFLAVGDAFNLLAGNCSFAPSWMQRSGLTWLHRLVRDPRRLGTRYLKFNLLFLFYMLRQWLGQYSRV